MKLRIWCDSGANIHSKREEILTLDQVGVTEEEWRAMHSKERDEIVKDIALAALDWGYQEME